MCGIAGVLRFRGEGGDEAIVQRMLSKLARRGPDDSGVAADGPAVLGNRRLAILDLSPAGHQPMRSPSGRYWITFNGEIYNHDEVRAELGVPREALRSSTDTEILLRAWERWGDACLPRFAGQWAFAIYDTAERRVTLARDRFGEKPLFYHANGARFVFASSLEAVLQDPETPRQLDPAALGEFVTLRYVVAPRTVLREVRKLPGGHVMTVSHDGRLDERGWYEPRFRRPARAVNPAALVEEFDALFARAAKRTLVSDVPVALLLSDGIDSNAVRATLAAQGVAPPSFTFRVREAGAGVPPARAAADGGGEIHDLEVSAADRVDKIAPAFAALTEPVGDGAALATWMLIRAARDRATVFLCGHGGDEVLGGYRLSQDRFRLALLQRLSRMPLAQELFAAPLDRFLNGDEPLAARCRALAQATPDTAPAAARWLVHRPLPPGDVRLLLGAAPAASARYLGTVERLYDLCAADARDVDRMQEVMLRTFLSENILSFGDATAMASSAELRMPFLDRDLVEFVLGLPPEARVSKWPGRTNTKLVLRWWAEGRLPAAIRRRRKRGFQFGNLSALVAADGPAVRERVLGSRAVRAALPGVEAWLARPAESFRGPWEGTLWALLALGVWCEAVGVRAD